MKQIHAYAGLHCKLLMVTRNCQLKVCFKCNETMGIIYYSHITLSSASVLICVVRVYNCCSPDLWNILYIYIYIYIYINIIINLG